MYSRNLYFGIALLFLSISSYAQSPIPDFRLGDRIYFSTITEGGDLNWSRFHLSNNLQYNKSTNSWYANNSNHKDFAQIRLENGGNINFFAGKESSSSVPLEVSEVDMKKYSRLFIKGSGSNAGNIGIGTTDPTEKLQIENGNIKLNLLGSTVTNGNYIGATFGSNEISFSGLGDSFEIKKEVSPSYHGISMMNSNTLLGFHLKDDVMYFGKRTVANNNQDAVINFGETTNFKKAVSIGSKQASGIYANYELSVDGQIIAKEIVVQEENWADYVFAKDYQLKPLSEVENYLDENQHLPGVPTAIQVKEEGLKLGDMQRIQMEKIEELTLYMIELKKQNDVLTQEVKTLKSALNITK